MLEKIKNLKQNIKFIKQGETFSPISKKNTA